VLIYSRMKSFISRAVLTVMTTAVLLNVGLGAQNRNAVPRQKAEGRLDDGFAAVVEHTMTAVVNIASPGLGIFSEGFTGRREAAGQGRMHCLGSGVIVTPDGYIVTSHHVVERALDIKVLLWDNRELTAQIVGTDPKTDVAVLKVDAVGLPVSTLGSSSSVHVGDVALAIGNPFGLRQTVTMGIISATGRSGLGILNYEDFIQTDAAMHPGSSGGPLINVRGELIGIVTAGLKDYEGVGFAVPVDLVRSIMDEILLHGRVIRGWLGVTVQPLTLATSKAFGLTADARGALVADVTPGGPASHAGFLAGDVITELDGKPLRDDRELNLVIGTKAPGTIVRLKAYREGREAEFTVNLMEEPKTQPNVDRDRLFHFSGPLGLSVQTIASEVSKVPDLRLQTRGVIVTDVESGSRAAAAAIMEGDIIVEVNRKPVKNTEEFYGAALASNSQSVLLLIERAGTRLFVVVE
jgi:serine protease Do